MAPGVYGLGGIADSWRRRLWISYLATGLHAVVSHESAGQLHGFTAIPRDRLTLIVPHGGHHRVLATRVHQISDVLRSHRTELDGLPVTTPARTFVDLSAVLQRSRLAICLDDAHTARKVTYLEVGAALRNVARRGKPGVRKLATMLDERGPGHVPAASYLERRLLTILEQGGEPQPRMQFPFPGRQVVKGCVDAAYPDARLILEADGRRWHSRIQDIARDRLRDNEAARAGWLTLRFLYEEIQNDPQDVVATVRETRLGRTAGHSNSRQ